MGSIKVLLPPKTSSLFQTEFLAPSEDGHFGEGLVRLFVNAEVIIFVQRDDHLRSAGRQFVQGESIDGKSLRNPHLPSFSVFSVLPDDLIDRGCKGLSIPRR